MKRFSFMNKSLEDDTSVDIESEDKTDEVVDTSGTTDTTDTETIEVDEETTPSDDGPTDDASTSSSERIAQRRRARANTKPEEESKDSELEHNPEDTSNVDAAIAAAAAKVNPSPDTVEDAAEKRRYAELVNNDNSEKAEEGEPGSAADEVTEADAQARDEQVEESMSEDEPAGQSDTTIEENQQEMSEAASGHDDATEEVADAVADIEAVESFLDMAKDSMLGNGVSSTGLAIGTLILNKLATRVGVKDQVSTSFATEAFYERKSATESFIDRAVEVMKNIWKRICNFFATIKDWIKRFFTAYKENVHATGEELKKLYKVYENQYKGKLPNNTEVVNVAVISDLKYLVTSSNNNTTDTIFSTAMYISNASREIALAGGQAMADWSQNVNGNNAGNFEFKSIKSYLPKGMSIVNSTNVWDVYNSQELAGCYYLTAKIPERTADRDLGVTKINEITFGIETTNDDSVKQLSMRRTDSDIQRLFSACFKLHETHESLLKSIRQQELDHATLERTLKHLEREVNNYKGNTELEMELKKKSLMNLSMQMALSKKMFSNPLTDICKYLINVSKASQMLLKKVMRHRASDF